MKYCVFNFCDTATKWVKYRGKWYINPEVIEEFIYRFTNGLLR